MDVVLSIDADGVCCVWDCTTCACILQRELAEFSYGAACLVEPMVSGTFSTATSFCHFLHTPILNQQLAAFNLPQAHLPVSLHACVLRASGNGWDTETFYACSLETTLHNP